MTGILLIRHGSAEHVGRRLAGRGPGVSLDQRGRAQAAALADALADLPTRAVYTSPMDRARETAAPLAERIGRPAVVDRAFNEVDFGDWTGRSFQELEGEEAWRAWNEFRSTARIPNGESTADILARALPALDRIRERHGGEWVAVVSHCDVIRPLLAHFAGMPLDHLLRLEVSPGSVSPVRLAPRGAWILGVNRRPEGLAAGLGL